jgi:hypothetical protein
MGSSTGMGLFEEPVSLSDFVMFTVTNAEQALATCRQ